MKPIAKKSHIAQIRERIESDQLTTQQVLLWSHEAFCHHQFEEYCAFVEELTEGWSQVREDILYSSVFRGFWISEWSLRNKVEFLPFAIESEDYEYVLDEYLFIHDHKRLLEEDEFMNRYAHLLKLL